MSKEKKKVAHVAEAAKEIDAAKGSPVVSKKTAAEKKTLLVAATNELGEQITFEPKLVVRNKSVVFLTDQLKEACTLVTADDALSEETLNTLKEFDISLPSEKDDDKKEPVAEEGKKLSKKEKKAAKKAAKAAAAKEAADAAEAVIKKARASKAAVKKAADAKVAEDAKAVQEDAEPKAGKKGKKGKKKKKGKKGKKNK